MMTCPKCGTEIKEPDKHLGFIDGYNVVLSGGELLIKFTCYAHTVEEVIQHVECCRCHYPNAVFGTIQAPQYDGGFWECSMRVPKKNYKLNCPAEKVCEKNMQKHANEQEKP